jgi:Ala-tRNA(Pro) deacylase
MAIAQTVADFLRQHAIPHDVLWHPYTHSSLASALKGVVRADKVVKAVVLADCEGLFMVLIPANRMVDLRAVEAYVGRPVHLAPPRLLQTFFRDCALGAIPATGPAYGFSTLCDEYLATADDLYFEAGDHRELIHVTGPAFREAARPDGTGQFSCGLFAYH